MSWPASRTVAGSGTRQPPAWSTSRAVAWQSSPTSRPRRVGQHGRRRSNRSWPTSGGTQREPASGSRRSCGARSRSPQWVEEHGDRRLRLRGPQRPPGCCSVRASARRWGPGDGRTGEGGRSHIAGVWKGERVRQTCSAAGRYGRSLVATVQASPRHAAETHEEHAAFVGLRSRKTSGGDIQRRFWSGDDSRPFWSGDDGVTFWGPRGSEGAGICYCIVS